MNAENIKQHLARVEKYGFDRGVFDFPGNDHRIQLLMNDAYSTRDDRLQVHITLCCEHCEMESSVRGKSSYGTKWTPRHMQDVKLAAFAPFFQEDCV